MTSAETRELHGMAAHCDHLTDTILKLSELTRGERVVLVDAVTDVREAAAGYIEAVTRYLLEKWSR